VRAQEISERCTGLHERAAKVADRVRRVRAQVRRARRRASQRPQEAQTRATMSAVTLVNPMAGQAAALELKTIVKSTLGVVLVLAVLVVLGDNSVPADYAGPMPRADDGNSVLLNLSANIKVWWNWLSSLDSLLPDAEL